MNKPVNDWNQWYIAQGFGNPTSYGFHEGIDLNLQTGGDTDLNQPLLSIDNGKVVYYHYGTHPTTNFGRHLVVRIEGAYGVRWVHYAHCTDQDFLNSVQDVRAGQMVARLGKSGTTAAHCHFSIFKVDPATLPSGIDSIAKTQQQLNDWWEDPKIFLQGDNMLPDEIAVKRTDFEKLVTKSTTLDEILAKYGVADAQGIYSMVAGKDSRITDLTNQLGTSQAEVKNKEEIISRLNQTIAILEDQQNSLTDRLDLATNTITQLGKDKGNLAIEVEQLKIQVETLKQQQAQGEVTLSISDLFKLIWHQKITIKK